MLPDRVTGFGRSVIEVAVEGQDTSCSIHSTTGESHDLEEEDLHTQKLLNSNHL